MAVELVASQPGDRMHGQQPRRSETRLKLVANAILGPETAPEPEIQHTGVMGIWLCRRKDS